MIPKKDEFPDFEVKNKDQVMKFELTERMSEGRKRDQEYKEAASGQLLKLPYRPVEEQKKAFEWADAAVMRKIKKSYSYPVNLLLYLNFKAHNFELDKFSELIASKINQKFLSIWLIISQPPMRLAIGRAYPKKKGFLIFDPIANKVILK